MAEGPSTALGGVVCRLPHRVVEERAQSCEMIHIQMLLLTAERREGGSRGVVMPALVLLRGINMATPLSVIILPNGEPCFQEGSGYLERRPNRTGQQLSERVLFFSSQMSRLVQEQRAVKPQVFAYSADLVPITPGRRRWLEG
jgi:hypothetical protein